MIFTNCIGQTVSLETMAQCNIQSQTCPQATYIKDVNNSLNKFIGTWKGTLEGKNYEFNFIKKENVGDSQKWDMLIGRVKIINSNGTIEYNNFNRADTETKFTGFNLIKDLKAYRMFFFGDKSECIDHGDLYLRIKPETPNNMTIFFLPNNDIVTQNCNNFKTTIPSEKIIRVVRQ